jgi:hypothetical protein
VTEFTADETRKRNIETMGEPLGEMYSALWQAIAMVYVYWKEYVELFGNKPSRIDLMNSAAPAFFHMLQEELWNMSLLHIARLTDRAKTFGKAGKSNLTITALPDLISDITLKTEVSKLVTEALVKTEFCRDWRNRRIAHQDLMLALGTPTIPLADASRLQVYAALESLQAVLNSLAGHYLKTEIRFDVSSRSQGAVALLYILDDGVKVHDARLKRLQEGKPLDEDFTFRDL